MYSMQETYKMVGMSIEELNQIQSSIDYIDKKQEFYDNVLSGKTKYYSNLIKIENK